MPRGGKRPGARRPRKRGWCKDFEIGQACETLWRRTSDEAVEARRAALPNAGDIQALQGRAKAIPVSDRRAWLTCDNYEDHVGDLEAWLHTRAGTPFDEQSASFEGAAPRRLALSTKPRRGTRQRIIAMVAAHYGISAHTADRLWKAYRRFEHELREAD